jgi:hypothetical protein
VHHHFPYENGYLGIFDDIWGFIMICPIFGQRI